MGKSSLDMVYISPAVCSESFCFTTSTRQAFQSASLHKRCLTFSKSSLAIYQFKSAHHYSETRSRPATNHYVYAVEIPDFPDDNHIDFKNPIHSDIIKRAEQKLGHTIRKNLELKLNVTGNRTVIVTDIFTNM